MARRFGGISPGEYPLHQRKETAALAVPFVLGKHPPVVHGECGGYWRDRPNLLLR